VLVYKLSALVEYDILGIGVPQLTSREFLCLFFLRIYTYALSIKFERDVCLVMPNFRSRGEVGCI